MALPSISDLLKLAAELRLSGFVQDALSITLCMIVFTWIRVIPEELTLFIEFVVGLFFVLFWVSLALRSYFHLYQSQGHLPTKRSKRS